MSLTSTLSFSWKYDSKNELSTSVLSLEDSFDYFILIEKICKLIYTNKYDTIFLIDRSARLAYIWIMEYMKIKYPDFKIPRIYFINPNSSTNLNCNWEFEKTYPLVYWNDKLNILCIDTCVHRWGTLSKVKEIFNGIGLNINYAVMNSAISVGKRNWPDHIVDASTHCYPFFKTRIFNKDKWKRMLCYLKPEYAYDISYEVQLRKDIYNIMRYFLWNYWVIEKWKKNIYYILGDSSILSNFSHRSRVVY